MLHTAQLRGWCPECLVTSLVSEIEAGIRCAPVVGIDETGIRQDGVPGYCWLARTETLSLYRVELSRGRWVAESILGAEFPGTLVSDFYTVYASQRTWTNAFCGAHLIRETKKIAELEPCVETAEFRDRVKAFYETGDAAAKSGDVGALSTLSTRSRLAVTRRWPLAEPPMATPSRRQARGSPSRGLVGWSSLRPHGAAPDNRSAFASRKLPFATQSLWRER